VAQSQDLISARLRKEARERLVGWTLNEIGDLFHAEGFSADTNFDPACGGARRGYVEQFYVKVDWTAWEDCRRMLRVFEALLDSAERATGDDDCGWRDTFVALLARDGFERDRLGRLRARWETLTAPSLAALADESSIPVLLARMWDNIEDHPDAAIGAAKEAIEATAKHVLNTRHEELTGNEAVPELVSRTMKALDVHATSVAPEKKGADTIRRVLGGLSQAALGVNDLRNSYGSGHGRPSRTSGLSPRHARLAAQSADAWVRFVLDTLQRDMAA